MNYLIHTIWYLVCFWVRSTVTTLTVSTSETSWSVAAENVVIQMEANQVVLSGIGQLKLTYTTSASTELINCNMRMTDEDCAVDTFNCMINAGYIVRCTKQSASSPLIVTLTIATINTANDNNTVLDFPASGSSNINDWNYTPVTIMALECPSTLTNAVAQLPSPCGFNCQGNFKCSTGYTGDFSGTCNAQAQWDATNTCTQITSSGLLGWEIALIVIGSLVGVALCVITAVAIYKYIILPQGLKPSPDPKPGPDNPGNGNSPKPPRLNDSSKIDEETSFPQ